MFSPHTEHLRSTHLEQSTEIEKEQACKNINLHTSVAGSTHSIWGVNRPLVMYCRHHPPEVWTLSLIFTRFLPTLHNFYLGHQIQEPNINHMPFAWDDYNFSWMKTMTNMTWFTKVDPNQHSGCKSTRCRKERIMLYVVMENKSYNRFSRVEWGVIYGIKGNKPIFSIGHLRHLHHRHWPSKELK